MDANDTQQSAEDAFQCGREAYDRLYREFDELRMRMSAARSLLLPLGNQPVPNVLAIREAIDLLR